MEEHIPLLSGHLLLLTCSQCQLQSLLLSHSQAREPCELPNGWGQGFELVVAQDAAGNQAGGALFSQEDGLHGPAVQVPRWRRLCHG